MTASIETPTTSKRASTQVNPAAFLVFVLASSFYLYEFILQVSPAVMYHGLMLDFKVGAEGLGLLSAAYFWAYAPTQVPAGLLFDRFGPRRMITIAITICAVGAIFFSLTTSFALAEVGRFFMGVGSAFSFIGVLVLVSRWFPPRYYALFVGITQFMSSVGAILGEGPLSHFVRLYGWRHTMLTIAIFGFLVSLLVWLFVRDYPDLAKQKEVQDLGQENELRKLIKICSRSQTWAVATYVFCIWAPVVVFAGLWGVPYLVNYYHISATEASEAVSWVWVGIGIGSPAVGWWSDYVGKRNQPLKFCGILGVIACIGILYLPHVNYYWMLVYLFAFGFAAGGQALTFAVVNDSNRLNYMGTASGFNNMATVAGGALIQPLVGYLLIMFWQGHKHFGTPVYTISAYQKALTVLPILFFISWLFSMFFIKETHCKPQY